MTAPALISAPDGAPASPEAFIEAAATFKAGLDALRDETARVIVGQGELVAGVLAAVLARGHVLLEGPPGLGKTLLARTIAQVTGLSFNRVQCTPDLMPADVTGTTVLVDDAAGGRRFEFRPGPVFAHMLLVDEINRAVPRTQSAMLEAMQERTVTVGDTTHPLPDAFTVLATRNPEGDEGTYRLPEAQQDRFMVMLQVRHPSADELATVVDRTTGGRAVEVRCRLAPDFLTAAASLVRHVWVSSHLHRWVADLVVATDPSGPAPCDALMPWLDAGAGPRAGQAMLALARVAALSEGRPAIGRRHIKQVAAVCLCHRLALSPSAIARGIDHREVVRQLLDAVPVPVVEDQA